MPLDQPSDADREQASAKNIEKMQKYARTSPRRAARTFTRTRRSRSSS